MKIFHKYIFALLLVLIFGETSVDGQESVAAKIVVHNTNPISELKKRQISNLFLKKVTRWETDQKVLPADLTATNPVRDVFSEMIHSRSVAVIKAYWQTQIFAGRASPPPEKETDTEVLQYVSKNKGAIGYVSDDADLEKYDVKVIELSD